MNKKILPLTLLVIVALPQMAYAVCPVCTIAVVAGLGLSRWLGIDDTISGIWIGGLIVSLTFWTLDWLKRKNINFPFKEVITTVAYYALVIVPLYWGNIIGHPLNQLWGLDKLIVGIIVGSVAFVATVFFYEKLKKENDGHAYFPFQKVVMPVSALLIFSLIFYYITLK